MINIVKCLTVILLLLINNSVFSQVSRLDLTQPAQQNDFLEYLKRTVALLDDSSLKEMANGIDLKKPNDSSKLVFAKRIMNDTSYSRKLHSYFGFLKELQNKYHIEAFTDEDWRVIAHFGADHGIYFLSRMQKLKENNIGNPFKFFPTIPQLKSADSINTRRF